MICQYYFALDTDERIPAERAYAFYSCLLSMLPYEYAEQLHEQGETPISQFLYFDREKEKTVWQITVLGDDAAEVFCPILDGLTALELNSGTVDLLMQDKRQYSAGEFIAQARSEAARRWETLLVLSPTAFRQNGRYVIIPQERLIIQSLISKWNAAFPEYLLDDGDVVRLLEGGVHISDYTLRSVRFPLKSNKIPGYIGSITLETRLAAPIMEIWNLLLHFAPYSGIGIKTALGMGGVAKR